MNPTRCAIKKRGYKPTFSAPSSLVLRSFERRRIIPTFILLIPHQLPLRLPSLHCLFYWHFLAVKFRLLFWFQFLRQWPDFSSGRREQIRALDQSFRHYIGTKIRTFLPLPSLPQYL